MQKGFEHLVNVLRHEAYIDRLKDLASENTLIPPTVYLAQNGGAFEDVDLKSQFLRWIYLASIWSRYTGSTETKLQKDISVLGQEDPVGQLVNHIIDERGRTRLEAKDLDGKSAQSSVYKFSYVVARALGARDWISGQVLYNAAVGASNGLESHHIFPRAVLKKLGYTSREHRRAVNEVANRAFLTQRANRSISARPPSEYLPEVQEQFPGALQAQSVTMNQDLWEPENFELFLSERRKLLASAMNHYLDSLVPEKRATHRSTELIEYLRQDESGELEFKSSLRYDLRTKQVNKDLEKVVAKSVAGLLNSKSGGVLLIGVQDHNTDQGLKEVFGLSKDYATLRKNGDRDGFELKLTDVICNHLTKSVMAFVTISFHEFDGEDVCQVTVEPADHPIYCHEGGENYTFYLRTGNSTKPLSLPDVAKYVATRWQ